MATATRLGAHHAPATDATRAAVLLLRLPAIISSPSWANMEDKKLPEKPPARASRVLAALDNPAFLSSQTQPHFPSVLVTQPPATPLHAGFKRDHLSSPEASGSGSRKKMRAFPDDERENTPGAFDLACK